MTPCEGNRATRRVSYTANTLTEREAGTDPKALFDRWMNDARASHDRIHRVAPTVLLPPEQGWFGTVDRETGQPSGTPAVVESSDDEGLVLRLALGNRAAAHLRDNPRAAFSFFWPDLQRQVRFEGLAELLDSMDPQPLAGSAPLAVEGPAKVRGIALSAAEAVAYSDELLHAYLLAVHEAYARLHTEQPDLPQIDPFAMRLATARPIEPQGGSLDGEREFGPSQRVVLVKNGPGDPGILFFTNYQGRKGRDLAANPLAAVSLECPLIGRALEFEGTVDQVLRTRSVAYFLTRDWQSRVGAWASNQSEVIFGRPELLLKAIGYALRFAPQGGPPCPPHWGGYTVSPTACWQRELGQVANATLDASPDGAMRVRLHPEAWEFWQGRKSGRMHDRLRYELAGVAGYRRERLSP